MMPRHGEQQYSKTRHLTRVTAVVAFFATIAMTFLAIASAGSKTSAPTPSEPETPPPIRYNRDVRPILSNHCFACHGPDRAVRKGKFRLDQRRSAIDRGAIVPGKPDASALVERIHAVDDDKRMPPPEFNRPLTDEQRQTLERWIASGAEYEPHWAYQPITRPDVPLANTQAIDAFVWTKLERAGFRPAPRADKRTLLRRLTLDLTGLPPSPRLVASFLADDSDHAYEKQVDRLLADPAYGERMAVPWLDWVRYADTVGYHGDQETNIFPYRDYVIDAFNDNMAFDRFTIEQLAGDLLPHPTTAQLVATGFNRLNMMTREGGAQPGEYLAKYAADRVRTISTAWLGSTMACCECHDHKFDPFTTRDFYRLSAYFADITEWGVYNDYAYTPNPDLRGFSNSHPFPPEINVPSPYLMKQIARIANENERAMARAISELDSNPGRQVALAPYAEARRRELQTSRSAWLPARATSVESKGRLQGLVAEDGSVQFALTGGKKAKGDRHEVRIATPSPQVAALRVTLHPEAIDGGTVAVGQRSSAALRVSAKRMPKSGKSVGLKFYHADATAKKARYREGHEIIGVLDRWQTDPHHAKETQSAIYMFDPPVQLDTDDRLIVTLNSPDVAWLTFEVSALPPTTPGELEADAQLVAALLSRDSAVTSTKVLKQAFLLGKGLAPEVFDEFRARSIATFRLNHGRAMTMVTRAKAPRPTYVLRRGDWQDPLGQPLTPAPPAFLVADNGPSHDVGTAGLAPASDTQASTTPAEVETKTRATRLDLARWLVSRDNPLTARAFVNRIWQLFFGRGLSARVEDLGSQGEPPLQGELLDWLAADFQSHWDIKRLVRLIVMSDTYQQSSAARPEMNDPDNRLLGRQVPRRLDAEFIRDSALLVAGLLDRDIGGPSSRPYQPEGYYRSLNFPRRRYRSDSGRRQYRRGLYTHWQRTFLHPMLANFDAPSREECVAARTISNTPQQALTLLNDPTFFEAARHLATSILHDDTARSTRDRLECIFERALSRPVSDDELASLTAFLATQRAHYATAPDAAAQVAATGIDDADPTLEPIDVASWTSVCRVVLNLHELLTRY